MSVNVPTAFAEQYSANVQHLVQQRGSVLRRGMTIKPITDAKRQYIEQIGSVAAQLVTSRHGDSPQVDTPHQVTALDPNDYDWGDFVDKFDNIKMKIDATGAYTVAASWAMGRAMDDIIITAATANSNRASGGTAATSTSSAAFPAAQQISKSFVEAGAAANSGLTVGKLREARKILREGLVQEDDELFIAVRAQQVHDLLKDDEVTSIDFNTVRSLVDGSVHQFMGFTFLMTQRLAVDSTDTATCLAWARTGMCLGIGMDVTSRITERDDKRYSWYVYYMMSMGCARLEDEKVVDIQCDESP